jgi:hypothetical protein
MRIFKASALAMAIVAGATIVALGAPCPQVSTTGPDIPSEVRTLEGSLVFHNDIRGYFELKLDHPECGEPSVQLTDSLPDWTAVEVLRGCRVRSRGVLVNSPTGYYTLNIYQAVDRIEPVGPCTRQPPFPDYSNAKPDKAVGKYEVDMYIDYEPEDHPLIFHVTSEGKELHPWQAYAGYLLTGGYALYGHCAKGFFVDKVFGTPQAKPSHFSERGESGDWAAFDPEGAAASGKKDLHLGYTCVRQP